jgi:hypothetical protein
MPLLQKAQLRTWPPLLAQSSRALREIEFGCDSWSVPYHTGSEAVSSASAVTTAMEVLTLSIENLHKLHINSLIINA